jgi:4-hydroxybutyrate CoA-transferase
MKTKTPSEGMSLIQPGWKIYLSGNSAVPSAQVIDALVDRALQFDREITVFQLLSLGPDSAKLVDPKLKGHLRLVTPFVSEPVRAAVNDGRADFMPCFLSEVPSVYKFDAAILQVGPPDKDGISSTAEGGLCVTPARNSDIVIAEINSRMPHIPNPGIPAAIDARIPASMIDYAIPIDHPLISPKPEPITEAQRRIAAIVAGLIPDGATLQMGIGTIPDLTLEQLGDRKNLGIHTELFSKNVIGLDRSGVINGMNKTIHRGRITAGFVLGPQEVYDFVNENKKIALCLTEYINDPYVIAANPLMTSINSAIQVDLFGNVCAHCRGADIYSGVGGQVDFVSGARRCNGGKSIIALPSTAKDGKISRIVNRLDEWACATTSFNHVDIVVTEFGAARLRGKTLKERAKALVEIADPRFREELRKNLLPSQRF